jgi:sugar lactone lactonase YvrE
MISRGSRRVVCFVALHICGIAVGSASSAAQADSSWRDHERALQAARAGNDTAVYRAQLRAIHREIGATPRIAARFATLAIGTHDKAEAAQWMGAVAAMGSALDSGMLAQYDALEGSGASASLMSLRARSTSDVGAPALVFRLPDADMISEDIAFDAARSLFLVSSVHRGGIYAKRIPGASPASVKFTADSSWGIFALGVDSARRVLWATTSALPMTAHYSASDSGRSALLSFDLASGTARARYVAPDTGAHALGDLTIGANGAVYVADGLGSGVYVLDSGSSTLRTLVPRGVLVSPQTPALSRDGATLFVPDYAIGIAAVRIATGEVTWIAHSDSLSLTGIDGMYRMGNDLIVVQNGVEPSRIVRLTLDKAMRRVVGVSTLARGSSAADITHATMSRGWLYFIRKSGWDRVADDGTMRAGAAGDAPEVVRVPLAPSR